MAPERQPAVALIQVFKYADGMSDTALDKARVTVDLDRSEYAGLRLAAAEDGPGTSMASILRGLVREYLAARDSEDAADIALARSRVASGATMTTAQLDERLADLS